MDEVCKVDGCNEMGQPNSRNGVRYLTRGMCHNHYQKWRKYGDPLYDGHAAQRTRTRKERVYPPEKACRNCGVVQPLENYFKRTEPLWYYLDCKACISKKRSAKHIENRIKNPKPPRQPKVYGPCAFEGCRNLGKSSITKYGGPEGQFCNPHWFQQKRHGTLKPLENSKRSKINDDFRMCTHCDRVKPQEEFHKRSGGGSQTQCKECQQKVVRVNYLLGLGRHQEALETAQSMADGPREIYVDKVSNRIEQAEFERSNGGTNE